MSGNVHEYVRWYWYWSIYDERHNWINDYDMTEGTGFL